MLTLSISQADSQKLKYERFRHAQPIIQKRLHALYLIATTDFSRQHIARILDLHPDTLTNYVRSFNQGGYQAITTLNYPQKRSPLHLYKDELTSHFERYPPQSVAQAAQHIESTTGWRRRGTQVRYWLHQFGFNWRKTGGKPAKADARAQASFLADQLDPLLEKARQGQLTVLFLDSAHFVMGAFLGYVWCLLRLMLPTPSGRHRLNVLGAVDAVSRQIHLLSNSTYITAPTIVTFLTQLRQAYGVDKVLWVVLDNARYQRCKLVAEAAVCLGIHLLYLPPYSPNLNLIERLWRWVKKRCLYGQYYATFESFSAAILLCLTRANTTHQIELERLLSHKFQRL